MIHPQLKADCHRLGHFDRCVLLLHRNAGVPWFILVPDTTVTDFLDLPAPDREAILVECAAISQFIKHRLGYSKVNFAGLGNVVPQLHLHVVGRSEEDPCWPSPVWGVLPEGADYDADLLTSWQRLLVEDFALSPASLSS
jgi:diadenosine tetraphosphate (Ap4A) HIT family hydrolase